jgi:formylglycine-generating enzyme required for sulfatase activity
MADTELQSTAPVTIFYSYSHRDSDLREELEEHLSTLRREKIVQEWHDRQIGAGEEWKDQLDRNLNTADIILLLISASFLRSDYCWDVEMKRALERHDRGEAIVIPIILRPCDWLNSDFSRLQALPREGRPVTTWADRDAAFLDVVQGIRGAVKRRLAARARPSATSSAPAETEAAASSAPSAASSPVVTPPEAARTPPASLLVNPKDGAEMLWIPAGEFLMGSSDSDQNAGAGEKPQRRVYLDAYSIYKNPVTVAQYRKFCAATGRQMPSDPSWGWKEDHPIVNVSWEDATAYARWAGVSLPTEAQWEKAARGTDGRKYPWGDKWDASRCSNGDTDLNQTTAVGSFPQGASPYGVLDMAGNVWEWCADRYDGNYYQAGPKRNPQGPESGDVRVLRGGSWGYANPADFRCAYRYGFVTAGRGYILGFRCASRADFQ